MNDGIGHYVVLVDEVGNPSLYTGKGGEVQQRQHLTADKWVLQKDHIYFPGKGFQIQRPPICIGYDTENKVAAAITANRAGFPRENFSRAGFVEAVDVLQEDGSYKPMGVTSAYTILRKDDCLFREEAKGLRFLYLRTSPDEQQDAYVERTYTQDSFPLDILFSDVKIGGTYTANLSRREITNGKL